MAPKIKIEKEMILSAAIDCVREEGPDSLTVRNIAQRLNCSIQPIFRVFTTMDNLKMETIKRASDMLAASMYGENNDFGKVGLAYVKFAREEKQLFKLLYMNDFRNNVSFVNATDNASDEFAIRHLSNDTGISFDNAKQLYLEMWIFTHGIASMLCANTYQFTDSEIEVLLDNAFTAFLNKNKNNI